MEQEFKLVGIIPEEAEIASSLFKMNGKARDQLLFSYQHGRAAKTVWVQDFEDWNKRDYGRPVVDAHTGMLPPKVARMMINVALSGKREEKSVILDPFCGVGTILAEALILGANVIGSDINQRQIEKTQKNLEWFKNNYKLLIINYKLFCSDARKISTKIQNVDAIVTEPYLGPDRILENLYLTCFEDWKKVLKPGRKVVIVLPSFGSDDSLVKKVIDKVTAIGYILEAGPFSYFRPQAMVKRNICVFKYGSH